MIGYAMVALMVVGGAALACAGFVGVMVALDPFDDEMPVRKRVQRGVLGVIALTIPLAALIGALEQRDRCDEGYVKVTERVGKTTLTDCLPRDEVWR